jgi:hypothetical protein
MGDGEGYLAIGYWVLGIGYWERMAQDWHD